MSDIDKTLRERLGRQVRSVWVEYCKRVGDTKPSHRLPWEELSETDKEVDRCIGSALYLEGIHASKIGAALAGLDGLERVPLPFPLHPLIRQLQDAFKRLLKEGR